MLLGGCFCMSSFAQTQVGFKDLANKGVSLTSSANVGFAPLTPFFNSASADVVALRPYSFILANSSPRRVVAYGLLWTFVNASGKSSSFFTRYVQINEFLDGGQPHATKAPPSTYSVASQQRRFLSPFFNLPSIPSAGTQLPSAQDFIAQHQNDTAVSLAIDSAVFEDGTCIGPDSRGLCARVGTILSARQDLFQKVLQAADDTSLISVLSSAAAAASLKQAPTTENLYQFFQADAAQPVSAANTALGAAAARKLAQQLAYTKPPTIVRQ